MSINFEISSDDFLNVESKKMPIFQKFFRFSGLSKAAEKEERMNLNEKVGKARRSSKKRPRFLERTVVDDFDVDEVEYLKPTPSKPREYSHFHQHPVHYNFTIPVVDNVDVQNISRNLLTLREIFELWGVSQHLSNGKRGDGQNIEINVCSALRKHCDGNFEHIACRCVNDGLHEMNVRLYDMNDPNVVSIIARETFKYMFSK